ncbi:ferredoxin family protein [Arcanobacterium hippocoleae]|uniref:Ferredoxin-like protein n=1 Tax=Arcanobacterium hippocoleae TaxID=149017 RepID=A0ABU1T2V3_9ACTO|nr:4Fe-4S dicluster domain-containing protein [Arcanobacterium hippocoleae]MDR6939714.1 ferredoxin like protein [Arcanobacterium hippocoleae]
MARSASHQHLAHTNFETDEIGHIQINQQLVQLAGIGETLIKVCPAGVYSRDSHGEIQAEYAACLECGTCRQIAPEGALSWHYPRGAYGVMYTQG